VVRLVPSDFRRLSLAGFGPDEIAAFYPTDDGRAGFSLGGRLYVLGLRMMRNGDCLFLSGGRCEVYRIRPSACRAHPFELRGKDVRLKDDARCPAAWAPEDPEEQARQMRKSLREENAFRQRASSWDKKGGVLGLLMHVSKTEKTKLDEDESFMRAAIKVGLKGTESGQSPFGACVVKDGRIVASAHNTVWADTDSTRHAEINAIRKACRKLKSVDLSGCTVYSTCEPCPMCFSACHWAKISRIVYGASIDDALAAGFKELHIHNRMLKARGKSPVRITSGCLAGECRGFMKSWKGRTY